MARVSKCSPSIDVAAAALLQQLSMVPILFVFALRRPAEKRLLLFHLGPGLQLRYLPAALAAGVIEMICR